MNEIEIVYLTHRGTVFIPLTRGKYALIDEADLPLVSQYRWHAKKSSRTYYARTWLPRADGKRGTLWMHRLFLTVLPGTKSDHINHNGLDNRRHNLRLANDSQSNGNRRKWRGAYSSQFKGVDWSKKREKWRVRIKINGVERTIGFFPRDQEEAAARAYDRAVIQHRGEFAHTNFPLSDYLPAVAAVA